MDTLFLTILMITVTCLVLGLAGGIVWCIERITWNHISIALTLITTIGSTIAGFYAYWHTYRWWTFALIALAIAHGFYISWYTSNSEKLNRPIYRVGGGDVTPRLHR